MAIVFPRVYPILDSSVIPETDRRDFLRRLGQSLTDAGVTLLEYRNKTGSDDQLLADAAVLRLAMPHGKVNLILDDRADLVARTNFDGAHVDFGDVAPRDARKLLGPDCIIGTFGGCGEFLPGILDEPVDYWAIGPVFTTTTKQTDKRPIGLDGVSKLRAAAGPAPVLTAAAGITLATAAAVLEAGATSVAVAAAIFRAADPAAEFLRWTRHLQ